MCGGNFDISIAWSAAPTVALLLVYLGLTLGIVSLGGDPEERQLEGKTSGGRISFPTRAAVILWFAFVAQVAYYGPLSSKALMPALLLQGLNKALAWYFTSRAVCNLSGTHCSNSTDDKARPTSLPGVSPRRY